MLKEKLSKQDIIVFDNGLYGQKINQNTLYITSQQSHCSSKQLFWNFPPKLRNRLVINQSGLNRLPTTIVQPKSVANLTQESLVQILDYSNILSAQIGLPETKDLIIRTSKENKPIFGRKARTPRFSEPALLRQTLANSDVRHKLLEKGGFSSSPISLEDFLSAAHQSYLMVHPDHFALQKESLHGRLLSSKNGSELVCATEVLHSRGLTGLEENVPVIRINADYYDDLFDFDPYTRAETVKQVLGRPSIYLQNPKRKHDSFALLKTVKSNHHLIIQAYRKASEIFGEETAMEFRIFPTDNQGIGKNFHVLDVDKKF